MTEIALTLGSALLAFGPLLALFSLLVYQKAQLVIVVTSAAFFFLLAASTASFVWYLFDAMGLHGPLPAILPGILFQFLFRCAFTALYHKVEAVIQQSMERQYAKEQAEHASTQPPAAVAAAAADQQAGATTGPNNNNHHQTRDKFMEYAKLRLALNDASCGIASGVGYGGMHAVLLYGTLIASETNDTGILYQDSCPAIPALVVSAIYAFFFSILDIFWMLLTFFGMRRRLLYHRGEAEELLPHGGISRRSGSWFGNSRAGGNYALLYCLLAHTAAAFFTLADHFRHGCMVSLPVVGGIVLFTLYVFWSGCGRIYMPPGYQPPVAADDASDENQADANPLHDE